MAKGVGPGILTKACGLWRVQSHRQLPCRPVTVCRYRAPPSQGTFLRARVLLWKQVGTDLGTSGQEGTRHHRTGPRCLWPAG